MSSCPELSRRALGSPKLTPPLSNSPHRRRSPLYHSHPVTPRTFRSRLGRRFRRVRPWRRSPVGSSRSISPNPPPEPIDEFKLQTGKERRRRARDSGEERGSRSSDEPVPMISAPTELEGTRQLAVAGVILATSDLDRLSVMARRRQEKRKSRAEQTQSV
ncbi:hypothetical protein NW755_14941 [Fusarium falciforme]|uniref:Uncharacterized protein n=1 Tax=Fusarium falciforme TaxID=195108 RepID=A0A9W8R977_9HYPO|nr:hypothetical protein NW755_14941 [Fusarium falciforme]